MGRYTGSRTQHALERTKSFFVDHDFEGELARTLEVTKNFLSGHERRPNFSYLANVCETTSFKNCTNVNDIGSIDFSRWRFATELRLLQYRIDATTPFARSQLHWPTASCYLNLAISLGLTDRDTIALPIFHKLASGLDPVLAQMSSRKEKRRNWGAVAFVFHSVLGTKDVPTAFGPSCQLTLEQAKIARPSYSDARDPYGKLLGTSVADLIPVELIFMSRALGHPDQELAELDHRIKATTYPANETFQEIDIEMSIAGI